MKLTTHSYQSTREDRTTQRKWAVGVGLFYGSIALILFGLAIVLKIPEPQSDLVATRGFDASKDMAHLNTNISAVQP